MVAETLSTKKYMIEPLSDVQCLAVSLPRILKGTTSSLVAGRYTIDILQAVYAKFGSGRNLQSPEHGCIISSGQSVEFHQFHYYPDDLVMR